MVFDGRQAVVDYQDRIMGMCDRVRVQQEHLLAQRRRRRRVLRGHRRLRRCEGSRPHHNNVYVVKFHFCDGGLIDRIWEYANPITFTSWAQIALAAQRLGLRMADEFVDVGYSGNQHGPPTCADYSVT
jgi:hypothetical protein